MVGGAIWMMKPETGPWSLLIALLPWGFRLIGGRFPFKRTVFDWLIAIFLVTAWVGYWAAYNKTTAWSKVWLIVLAVLLYYALSTQPKENLVWLSALSFCLGVAVSVYFFLIHDFTDNPGKIALWWMNVRPQLGWAEVHHGYISGVLVITSLFASYGFWEIRKQQPGRLFLLINLLLLAGSGIIVLAFALTLSRGIWLAIGGAVGVWIIWKILTSSRLTLVSSRMRSLFPVAVLIYLSAIIFLVYIGPGGPNYNITQSDFGGNTRSEVFLRGVYFLEDFPITGGGLSSFPGLYSQYILVIPFHYFTNSYNLFLDAAIEQGMAGGLVLVSMYLGSIWLLSRTITTPKSLEMQVFSWLSLSALIVSTVHGMFYDYFYNGMGTFLLFFPVGASMISVLDSSTGTKHASANPWLMMKGENFRVKVFVLTLAGALLMVLIANINKIGSIMYANLGAVQMARVELADFPAGKWRGTEIVPQLESAEATLLSALQLDPANQTANHRLGLISMSRQDFQAASKYLEMAYHKAPEHRGIVKSLGYCYAWLGEMDKAQALLKRVPEAEDELNAYVWWWSVQGRADLSVKATRQVSQLSAGQ
jgi:hypothetical protein